MVDDYILDKVLHRIKEIKGTEEFMINCHTILFSKIL